MREIKFRAWDGKTATYPTLIGRYGDSFTCWHRDGFFDTEELEQFIGLHDKNEKKIYEGDIDEARGICVWVEEDCRWAWQDIETGEQYGLFAIGGKLNIIGNIHENPELLND